jgi:hypothetical protein
MRSIARPAEAPRLRPGCTCGCSSVATAAAKRSSKEPTTGAMSNEGAAGVFAQVDRAERMFVDLLNRLDQVSDASLPSSKEEWRLFLDAGVAVEELYATLSHGFLKCGAKIAHKRAAARRRAKSRDDSREHFRADASNRGGCAEVFGVTLTTHASTAVKMRAEGSRSRRCGAARRGARRDAAAVGRRPRGRGGVGASGAGSPSRATAAEPKRGTRRGGGRRTAAAMRAPPSPNRGGKRSGTGTALIGAGGGRRPAATQARATNRSRADGRNRGRRGTTRQAGRHPIVVRSGGNLKKGVAGRGPATAEDGVGRFSYRQHKNDRAHSVRGGFWLPIS